MATDDDGVFSNHAMIKNEKKIVLTIVNIPDSFTAQKYYFVKIKDGVLCRAGMYYNEKDGLFYDDDAFTMINGVAVQDGQSI